MVKLCHAQTVLFEDDIKALKEKTGETDIKEALSKAVAHYLECEHTEKKTNPFTALNEVIRRRQGGETKA